MTRRARFFVPLLLSMLGAPLPASGPAPGQPLWTIDTGG
jgi:hypothetical protein